jgi:hypothetical protein
VDGREGRRVVRSQRLLPPGQRLLVHLLRLSQLALVPVQVPETVDGREGSRGEATDTPAPCSIFMVENRIPRDRIAR